MKFKIQNSKFKIGISFFILLLYDSGNGYVYNPQDWLNLPRVETIHSITADPFNVYIGTPEAIFILNKSEKNIQRTLTSSDGITGTIRICAFDQKANLLWIVADNRLIGYNPYTNFRLELLPEFTIRSIGVADTYLYFLTNDSPWRLRKKDYKFQMVKKTDTNAIWFGERNTYQVTNYPFLVPYFYLDENLVKHRIRIVFEDRKTLWVGADEYGVLTYDLVTKQLLSHIRLGFNIGLITNILPIDNNIWFLGSEGFVEHNPKTNQWQQYLTPFGAIFTSPAILLQPKILDLRRIQGISSIVAQQNNYWIGSGSEIYHYDLKSNSLSPILRFFAPIRKLLWSQNFLYFIAGNRLYRFDTKTKKIDTIFDSYQKIAFGVYDIYRTGSHHYFSVSGGFLSLDTLGNWRLHIPPGINLSLPFTTLTGFGDYLFLGSPNGVITYHRNTERYDYFTTKEGLLSNNVTALYADSNYLWVATDRGISRFTYRNVLPK